MSIFQTTSFFQTTLRATVVGFLLLSLPVLGEDSSSAESDRLVVKTYDSEMQRFPGVEVTFSLVTADSSEQVAREVSDGNGEVGFEVPSHGTYTLRAELEGFIGVTAGPFTLDQDSKLISEIGIMLPIAPMSLSVIN